MKINMLLVDEDILKYWLEKILVIPFIWRIVGFSGLVSCGFFLYTKGFFTLKNLVLCVSSACYYFLFIFTVIYLKLLTFDLHINRKSAWFLNKKHFQNGPTGVIVQVAINS